MIKTLDLKNFTVLPDAHYEFSPGLNVFVAENGMGKSHLLKILYALTTFGLGSGQDSKNILQAELEKHLKENFRAEEVFRLVRRVQGSKRCTVECSFAEPTASVEFSISSRVGLSLKKIPRSFTSGSVFFPTRELMSLCPWFVPAYELYHLEFERSWRDTCQLLQAPGRKGPRSSAMTSILKVLQTALGGEVILNGDSGRFYMKSNSSAWTGTIEMPMVAEGLRKLAMLYRLIQTGTFEDRRVLFWDEPEANLNPKYIRQLARCIWALATNGIQVFVASHSMILLREFMISQVKAKSQEVRWFSLAGPNAGLECVSDLSQLTRFTAMKSEDEQNIEILEMEF